MFDSFSGTLSVPFEKRIAGGISQREDMEDIEPHLVKIHAREFAAPNIATARGMTLY